MIGLFSPDAPGDASGNAPGDPLGDAPICSRAGCRNAATMTVNWRNPRIHSIDRVKVWLACDSHVEYLRDYLSTRDFPVVVAPLGEPVLSVPAAAAAAAASTAAPVAS